MVDTVKTRMQGQMTTKSIKYDSLSSSIKTIFREEGLRGFYGGFVACILGSFSSTIVYFSSYEYLKRNLRDGSFGASSYFFAGLLDLW